MHSSTLFVLACLVVAVSAKALQSPAVDELTEVGDLDSVYGSPQDSSVRNKRSLLLLKKKLLLGALGLKAAKVGAIGAVAGAALASKHSKPSYVHIRSPQHHHSYGYSSHGPAWNVEVNSWH